MDVPLQIPIYLFICKYLHVDEVFFLYKTLVKTPLYFPRNSLLYDKLYVYFDKQVNLFTSNTL